MSLPRFFVEPADVRDGEACLTGPERDHMVRVLRLGPGARVILFDGLGNEYPARILEASRARVRLHVEPPRRSAIQAPGARIILIQGLPRLSRMDWLVEKVTEVGVSVLVPVVARRSPPEARRAAGRLPRWRKIAREACRQCGRAELPRIQEPMPSSEAWSRWGGSGRCALLDPEASGALPAWLAGDGASHWAVAVGPEGGWDEGERDAARAGGFVPVALGPRTLRAETAGLLAVATVQLLRGDLGAGRPARRH